MKKEIQELMERVNSFFEKKDIAVEDRYMTCKALQEEYWDNILSEDEATDEFEDEVDEFNDDVPEEDDVPEDDDEDDELAEEKPKPKDHKKGMPTLLKKPIVKIK